MKILFISMPSIHAIRWIENLKDSKHELYWFDVLNKGNLETLNSVKQFHNLGKRKLPYLKGEFFLSKKAPRLYDFCKFFLEITPNESLKNIINEIRPDCIHSFEMQGCSYPILKTMEQFPHIRWVYSCWGNDLFFYKNFPQHLKKIERVLKRVNFMHSDCYRDYNIAKQLGFKGRYLGVIPTGGGYHLKSFTNSLLEVESRKIILIKGYDHIFGRAINVIKAVEEIYKNYNDYKFVVFGAHQVVIDYINVKKLPFKVYDRNGLTQLELIDLMGKAFIYIGNNISDGMPNTVLEAIIMGAFPIQSNPGNATSEIIEDGVNGLLINDPENIQEIRDLILKALCSKSMIISANSINYGLSYEKLDYEFNRTKINEIYDSL